MNVAADLLLEGFERWEFLFPANLLDKGQFEFAIVQVSREIEQMDFGAEFGVGLIQGGTVTEIEHRLDCGGLQRRDDVLRGQGGNNPHLDCVDAGGGQDQLGDIEICRREPELTAQTIPSRDQAGDGVGAAEHL